MSDITYTHWARIETIVEDYDDQQEQHICEELGTDGTRLLVRTQTHKLLDDNEGGWLLGELLSEGVAEATALDILLTLCDDKAEAWVETCKEAALAGLDPYAVQREREEARAEAKKQARKLEAAQRKLAKAQAEVEALKSEVA